MPNPPCDLCRGSGVVTQLHTKPCACGKKPMVRTARNYTPESLYNTSVRLYDVAGGLVSKAEWSDLDDAAKQVWQWLASLANLDGGE